MHNICSQINFKTSMLRSGLCDYSDVYILVSRTTTVVEVAEDSENDNIEAVFKNCAPFTDCMSETNNTQIDNAKGIDIVMIMYNLIEYSDNYSKTSGSSLQYHRDETALTDAEAVYNFPVNSASFKFKQRKGKTENNGTKAIKTVGQLKYLSNFWKTLEMLLINRKINLVLTWSVNCVKWSSAAANQATTLAITGTKVYVPVVTLSTQDNAKLLQQLKSGFKHTIN